MKEVSWKDAVKHGFTEALIASILYATTVMGFMVCFIPISVVILLIGAFVFVAIFIFSVWDTKRQLINPRKKYSSYGGYRTYDNYVDRSGFGYDCGGSCDCGDCGGDGGC